MPFRVIVEGPQHQAYLPGTYPTEEEAEQAGENWLQEMVEADEDPKQAELEYGYDVVEV